MRREGVRALWKGLVPVLGTVAPARAIYFHTYLQAKTYLGSDSRGSWALQGPPVHLLAAATGGVATTLLFNPPQVIKTRLQIQTDVGTVSDGGRHLKQYDGVIDAVRSVYRQEG